MTSSLKDKIVSDLKKSQEIGKLRSDRIREIISAAISQLKSEFKGGSSEIRPLVKEAFSAVLTGLQETGGEVKESVTASVEGVLDGITSAREKAIADTEAEVKRLQAQLNQQEDDLEQAIETGIAGIQDAAADAPGDVREQITAAIDALQNTEEASLLRKRYAQLQAQASILRANLAARKENYYDQAQAHLDDARSWYSKARSQAESTKGQADQKFTQLEQQIGEAGAALARRERQVRQLLSDLLHRAGDAVKEDEVKAKPAQLPANTDQEI